MLIIIIIELTATNLIPIFNATYNTENQTEISIYNCFGRYSSKNTALSDMVEKYSQNNTDVQISNVSLSTKNFYTKLHADFSANCASDIIIAPPSFDILQLYKRGYIASLDAEFEKDTEWAESFDRNILRFVTSDDKIYGLPTDVEYTVLFCNNNLFKQCGLTIPKNYNELKNAVSTLAANNIIPFAFTTNDTNIYLYQMLVSMFEDGNAGSSSFLDEQYSNAMDYMKELYQIGAFPGNYDSLDSSEASELFLNGSAAMIATTNSFIDDIVRYIVADSKAYTKYINQFDIIAFPSENSIYRQPKTFFSNVAYNAGEFTIFINKKAYEQKHDEVMKLVKYLTSPVALREYLSQTNDILSIKYIENREYKGNRLVSGCKLAVDNATKFTQMPIDVTYRYIWENQLCSNIPKIFYGITTYDEVASKINEKTPFTDYKRN